MPITELKRLGAVLFDTISKKYALTESIWREFCFCLANKEWEEVDSKSDIALTCIFKRDTATEYFSSAMMVFKNKYIDEISRQWWLKNQEFISDLRRQLKKIISAKTILMGKVLSDKGTPLEKEQIIRIMKELIRKDDNAGIYI